MKITPGDIDRFTCGDCHILAYAIQKQTGWPIYCFSYQGGPTLHAFIKMPDGRFLDIKGAKTKRQMMKEWRVVKGDSHSIREYDWKYLRKDWGGAFGEYSYRRAHKLVPLLLEQINANSYSR